MPSVCFGAFHQYILLHVCLEIHGRPGAKSNISNSVCMVGHLVAAMFIVNNFFTLHWCATKWLPFFCCVLFFSMCFHGCKRLTFSMLRSRFKSIGVICVSEDGQLVFTAVTSQTQADIVVPVRIYTTEADSRWRACACPRQKYS